MQPPLDMTVDAGLMTAAHAWYDVSVRLRHSMDDALAVRMDLFSPEDTAPMATWVFGRDLLATGLLLPTGEGDVRVRPHGDHATDVELVSEATWCVVRIASAHVRDLVSRTRSAEERWRGTAPAELDRALAGILTQGIRND
ncbi:SsgA family sporulation/cell division regulator [Kitasatospora sp. NPDC004289]